MFAYKLSSIKPGLLIEARYNWEAVDRDGGLYAYIEEPARSDRAWLNSDYGLGVNMLGDADPTDWKTSCVQLKPMDDSEAAYWEYTLDKLSKLLMEARDLKEPDADCHEDAVKIVNLLGSKYLIDRLKKGEVNE